MSKFVRQQARFHHVQIGIKERAFPHAVVARLMMLDSVMTRLVAERQKKMIFEIVTRPEQSPGLGDQLAVRSLVCGRHRQSRFAFANHVDDVRRSFPWLCKNDSTVMFSRDQ